jgi:putative flippase GtrA
MREPFTVRKLLELFNKALTRELIFYGIFGALTVVVNIAAYWVLSRVALSMLMANTLAFLVAVTFAYLTNTMIVFQSRLTLRNGLEFYAMRIATLVIDDGGLWLLVTWGWHDLLAKCALSFLIIVINYLCSKFLIFNKRAS